MTAADPYVGRALLGGRFVVLERLGAGGMGVVYKAEEPAMERLVALKVLRPELGRRKDLVARFRREARAMNHLVHPNIARVHLYGQLDDGACFIAMEYLVGRDLAALLEAEGPLAPARAVAIVRQVTDALAEAHARGIVHRDLKPENILVLAPAPDAPATPGGDRVKVLDFGLARVSEHERRPGSVDLTREGSVVGTPEFMSPEQARGAAVDARTDLYSLGVILYELVTGLLPFETERARSTLEIAAFHVVAPPIPLAARAPARRFPPGLQPLLDRCLAKDPDARYPDAPALAAALAALAVP